MHIFPVFRSGKRGIYTIMPVKNPRSLIVLREHLFLLVQSFYSFNRNSFLLMRIHLHYILLIKLGMEWGVAMGGA